eukprot:TRINITY_DN487_c1_g2_i1.p1 TRINITY_DN487_c1_g2~~TRINITY_DN487_c1_g2_i1.p1  ORF type:complete len:2320 (+),score=491.29 TRINITY_DN487_c1_g2_i1:121-7080(+)
MSRTPAVSSHGKPCRFGRECNRADCQFEHPEGRRPTQAEPRTVSVDCARSTGVADDAMQYPPSADKPCRFGVSCNRAHCQFVHPDGRRRTQTEEKPASTDWVKSTPGEAGACHLSASVVELGGIEQAASVGTPSASSHDKPCRYGVSCNRADCQFVHPDGRMRMQTEGKPTRADCGKSTPGEMGVPMQSATSSEKTCRFGSNCKNPKCNFVHPASGPSRTPGLSAPPAGGERVFLPSTMCSRLGDAFAVINGTPVDGEGMEQKRASRCRIRDHAQIPTLADVGKKEEMSVADLNAAYVGTTVLMPHGEVVTIRSITTSMQDIDDYTASLLDDTRCPTLSQLWSWPMELPCVRVEGHQHVPEGVVANFGWCSVRDVLRQAVEFVDQAGCIVLNAVDKPLSIVRAVSLHGHVEKTPTSVVVLSEHGMNDDQRDSVKRQLNLVDAVGCVTLPTPFKKKQIYALLDDALQQRAFPHQIELVGSDNSDDESDAMSVTSAAAGMLLTVIKANPVDIRYTVHTGRGPVALKPVAACQLVAIGDAGHASANLNAWLQSQSCRIHKTAEKVSGQHRQCEVFDQPVCLQCRHSDMHGTADDVQAALQRASFLRDQGVMSTWQELQAAVSRYAGKLLCEAEVQMYDLRQKLRELGRRVRVAVSIGDREAAIPLKNQQSATRVQMKEFEEATVSLRAAVLRGNPHLSSVRILRRELERLKSMLPILSQRSAFVEHLQSTSQNVLLVDATTGSGKSTQLVQYAAEVVPGRIVCCQPNRFAAEALQFRVNREMGYERTNRVEFLDTRTLLNRVLDARNGVEFAQREMHKTKVIVVDELHERSLWTDMILPLLKELLWERHASKNHLHVILASATMDTAYFESYFARGDVPYDVNRMSVGGRTHPLTVRYNGQLDLTRFVDRAYDKILQVVDEMPRPEEGQFPRDILVFLPRRSDIHALERKLHTSRVQDLVHTVPLHQGLPEKDYGAVFQPCHTHIKVVLATNIAETSVTIDGVKVVIDTGVVHESLYDSTRGLSTVQLSKISKSSAVQRAGRAGRTAPGLVHRLYSQEDFDAMEATAAPEILRTDPMQAVLRLRGAKIDLKEFDFVTPLPEKVLQGAVERLKCLGILGRDESVTPDGERHLKSNNLRRDRFKQLCANDNIPVHISDSVAEAIAISSDVFIRGYEVGSVQVAGTLESCLGDVGTVLAVMREYRAASTHQERMDLCSGRFSHYTLQRLRSPDKPFDCSTSTATAVQRNLVKAYFDSFVCRTDGGLYSPARSLRAPVSRNSLIQDVENEFYLSFVVDQRNAQKWFGTNVPISRELLNSDAIRTSPCSDVLQAYAEEASRLPGEKQITFDPLVFAKLCQTYRGLSGWGNDVAHTGGDVQLDRERLMVKVTGTDEAHRKIQDILNTEKALAETAVLCETNREIPVSDNGTARMLLGNGFGVDKFLLSPEDTLRVSYEVTVSSTTRRRFQASDALACLELESVQLRDQLMNRARSFYRARARKDRITIATLLFLGQKGWLRQLRPEEPGFANIEGALTVCEEFVSQKLRCFRGNRRPSPEYYVDCDVPEGPDDFQLSTYRGFIVARPERTSRATQLVINGDVWQKEGIGFLLEQRGVSQIVLPAEAQVRVVSRRSDSSGTLVEATFHKPQTVRSEEVDVARLALGVRHNLIDHHRVITSSAFATPTGLSGTLYFADVQSSKDFVARQSLRVLGRHYPIKSRLAPHATEARVGCATIDVWWSPTLPKTTTLIFTDRAARDRAVALSAGALKASRAKASHAEYMNRKELVSDGDLHVTFDGLKSVKRFFEKRCKDTQAVHLQAFFLTSALLGGRDDPDVSLEVAPREDDGTWMQASMACHDVREAEQRVSNLASCGSYMSSINAYVAARVKVSMVVPISLPFKQALRVRTLLVSLLNKPRLQNVTSSLTLDQSGCHATFAGNVVERVQRAAGAFSKNIIKLLSLGRHTLTDSDNVEAVRLRLNTRRATAAISKLESQYPHCAIWVKTMDAIGVRAFIFGDGEADVLREMRALSDDDSIEVSKVVARHVGRRDIAIAHAKKYGCWLKDTTLVGKASDVIRCVEAMQNGGQGVHSGVCGVCLDDCTPANSSQFVGCKHCIHTDCLAGWFQLIEGDCEERHFPLHCPVCKGTGGVLGVAEVVSLADAAGADHTSLGRASLKQTLRVRDQVDGRVPMSCRAPDCEGLHLVARHGASPIVPCTDCGVLMCTECDNSDHTDPSLTCQRFEETQRRRRRTDEEASQRMVLNMKRCPKCRTPIEKNDGCNMMTCTCGCKFCWLCPNPVNLTKVGYEHFRDASSPCYKKLFSGLGAAYR